MCIRDRSFTAARVWSGDSTTDKSSSFSSKSKLGKGSPNTCNNDINSSICNPLNPTCLNKSQQNHKTTKQKISKNIHIPAVTRVSILDWTINILNQCCNISQLSPVSASRVSTFPFWGNHVCNKKLKSSCSVKFELWVNKIMDAWITREWKRAVFPAWIELPVQVTTVLSGSLHCKIKRANRVLLKLGN